MTELSTRLQALQSWVNDQIGQIEKLPAVALDLHPLSGDASFRRYFRVMTEANSYVVVDAPPETEDNEAFVSIANAFRKAGVQTPRVIAVDYAAGFMLQEDFGDSLYLASLQENYDAPDRIEQLYKSAIDSLVCLQSGVSGAELPPYDSELLLREMALFQDWFCGSFLNLTLSEQELELIEDTQRFLTAAALGQV